jgi:hypothetical protein
MAKSATRGRDFEDDCSPRKQCLRLREALADHTSAPEDKARVYPAARREGHQCGSGFDEVGALAAFSLRGRNGQPHLLADGNVSPSLLD